MCLPRRHQEEPPKNLSSYRIAEADRLGEGGPKQKFQQNLAAIRRHWSHNSAFDQLETARFHWTNPRV